MSNLSIAVKLYITLQQANLDSKRMYSFNYYMGMVTIFLNSISPIISFWVLTQYFHNVGGWGFYDLLLLYSMWRIGNGVYLTFFHHQVSSLDLMLIEGEFDKMLIRPHHPLFMFLSSKFNPDGAGDVISGIVCGLWAFYALHIPLIYFIEFLLLGLVGGFITSSIFIIISSISFWTLQSEGIRQVASRINHTFQAYPISIYNIAIQIVLTFILPFAFTSFFPVQIFLDPSKPYIFAGFFMYFTPVAALLGVFLAIVIWNKGLANYKSSGS